MRPQRLSHRPAHLRVVVDNGRRRGKPRPSPTRDILRGLFAAMVWRG